MNRAVENIPETHYNASNTIAEMVKGRHLHIIYTRALKTGTAMAVAAVAAPTALHEYTRYHKNLMF